jgi:hypothetical protein
MSGPIGKRAVVAEPVMNLKLTIGDGYDLMATT